MALDKDMIIPEHVALILDGNGRWAKKRGLPRTMGHKEGCVTVEKTVEIAARMGIRYLTVYGFSTENWKRSAEEVGALMQLAVLCMPPLQMIFKTVPLGATEWAAVLALALTPLVVCELTKALRRHKRRGSAKERTAASPKSRETVSAGKRR